MRQGSAREAGRAYVVSVPGRARGVWEIAVVTKRLARIGGTTLLPTTGAWKTYSASNCHRGHRCFKEGPHTELMLLVGT